MNLAKCCKYSWMSYYPVKNHQKNKHIISLEGSNSSKALYCKEENETYISFRGTYNKANMKSCMNGKPVSTMYGNVHAGFLNHYISIVDDIDSLLEKEDSQDIFFTGHSMGGSIAILSAMDNLDMLKKKGKRVHCRTFGTPCTSDNEFMMYARENLDSILNIELPNDVVPYLSVNPIFVNPSNLVILPSGEKEIVNINMMDLFKNHSCQKYYKGVFGL